MTLSIITFSTLTHRIPTLSTINLIVTLNTNGSEYNDSQHNTKIQHNDTQPTDT